MSEVPEHCFGGTEGSSNLMHQLCPVAKYVYKSSINPTILTWNTITSRRHIKRASQVLMQYQSNKILPYSYDKAKSSALFHQPVHMTLFNYA